MDSVSDYNSGTSNDELYHFLSRSIIEKGITDFSGLISYAGRIPITAKTTGVFESLFTLIRKLYWGFFRDVDPVSYPKVWKEIVLPHKLFPSCGDLKKNLTISNIFVGVLEQLSLEIRKKMATPEVAQIWRASVYACDKGSQLTIHSGKL